MRRVVLAVSVFLGGVTQAVAEDCTAPCVGSKISLGLLADSIFSATPSELEATSILPEFSAESYLLPFENFKFVSVLNLEQVIEPADGQDSTFSGLGLYQSELYGEFTFDPMTVKLGKFDLDFSLASEVGEGVNSTDLAGNADMDESLGMAAALDFDVAGHAQTLTGTLFTMDRSFLAKSYINTRPVPKLADGGAGNTTGLSSMSLVLDGCFGADSGDCHDDGQFGYRLGARYQRHGLQTEEQAEEDIIPQNELTFLAALQGNVDVGEDKLRLMAESAYIKNFEGNTVDALIVTGIAVYVMDAWTYSAAVSRQLNSSAEAKHSETLAELAITYNPEVDLGLPQSDWSIAGAYTYLSNEENQVEHILGLRLNLEFGGSYALK